jgi:hypothetical protein
MLRVIMRTLGIFLALAAASSIACSSNDKSGGSPLDMDSGTGGSDVGGGDSHFNFDTSPSDGLTGDITPNDSPTSGGTPIVYANTDTELWSLDPTTKAVTKIGAFSGTTDPITDVAVDGDDNVYVISETALYSAALPAGGTGAVALTLKVALTGGGKFYALGFAPKDVVTAGAEALIAGDINGSLYYIDTAGGSVQNLGSFGNWKTGDPNPSGKSTTTDTWTLSGDVVFYLDATGAPRGLATLRTCYTATGGTVKCYADNDALAEVDMTALKSNFDAKGSSASLRKNILGLSGTGRLFGLGAWEDTVYGFSRNHPSSSTSPAVPPELITMGASGVGTVAQMFGTAAAPEFTDGWSGAGVTTKAKISVIK